jgi:hypothetical protein
VGLGATPATPGHIRQEVTKLKIGPYRILLLSQEQQEFLVRVLHSQQDQWADTQQDLAVYGDMGDKDLANALDDEQDLADSVRKKLGDKEYVIDMTFSHDEFTSMIEEENS